MIKIRVSPATFEGIRMGILQSTIEGGETPSQRLVEWVDFEKGNATAGYAAWRFGDTYFICDPTQ